MQSNVSFEEIERLFLQEHLGALQIEERTGIPAHQVREILRDLGHDLHANRSKKALNLPIVMSLLEQGVSVKEAAERSGLPLPTVRRWLREEQYTPAAEDRDPRIDEAKARYAQGESAERIAKSMKTATARVLSWLRSEGVEIRQGAGARNTPTKRGQWISEVLKLHGQGMTTTEIADTLRVAARTTIEDWLRSEGLTPNYKLSTAKSPQASSRRDLKAKVCRLYLDGASWAEIGKQLNINPTTAMNMVKEAGVFGQGGKAVRDKKISEDVVRLYTGGMPLMEVCSTLGVGYYKAKTLLRAANVEVAGPGGYKRKEDAEPQKHERACEAPDCENMLIDPSPGRKYCSHACRTKWGAKRQADPANHITLTCLACGNEFTIPRSRNSVGKYCSNSCARKHTKTKQHFTVGDTTVLDSNLEVFFWGLCAMAKVAVERFDREDGIAWQEDGWYAPDFQVTWKGRSVAVETKGLEDPSDQARWAAFRAGKGVLLVVLTRDQLWPPPQSRAALLELLGLS